MSTQRTTGHKCPHFDCHMDPMEHLHPLCPPNRDMFCNLVDPNPWVTAARRLLEESMRSTKPPKTD